MEKDKFCSPPRSLVTQEDAVKETCSLNNAKLNYSSITWNQKGLPFSGKVPKYKNIFKIWF